MTKSQHPTTIPINILTTYRFVLAELAEEAGVEDEVFLVMLIRDEAVRRWTSRITEGESVDAPIATT